MSFGGGLNSLIPQRDFNNQNPQNENSGQLNNVQNNNFEQNQNLNNNQNQIPNNLNDNNFDDEVFLANPIPEKKEEIKKEENVGNFRNQILEQPIKEVYDDSAHQDWDNYHATRTAGFGKKQFLNDAIFHIEVDKIKPNPFQPRKQFDEEALNELAASIREYGILQPLVVSKIEKETETGTEVEYQLIAGERRLRASKLIGLERVPVIIRKTGEKKEHLELAIIENLQRADLDLIETARAYARLQDEFGLTQREIAMRMGKSREVISNTLRLLSLPSEIQEALSKNQLSESQARLLLSVSNPVAQRQLLVDILTNNLSVRELKNRITRMQSGFVENAPTPTQRFVQGAKEHEMQELEKKLKEILGTEVKIDTKGDSGKIVISFYSPEEVYGIVNKINPKIDLE